MYTDKNKTGIRNDLKFSIGQSYHQVKILDFLRESLHRFTQVFIDAPVPDSSVNIVYEDYISRQIVNFFNDKVRKSNSFLFQFHEKKGSDISICVSPYQVHAPAIFVIEAKRLPPTNTHDYVQSGIGRFKSEEHGKQYNVAAMLGYVQEKDFSHWYAKVNSWIDAKINSDKKNWNSSDRLREVQKKSMREYMSEHSRINTDPITLHHFWLDFVDKKL